MGNWHEFLAGYNDKHDLHYINLTNINMKLVRVHNIYFKMSGIITLLSIFYY